MYSRVQRAPVLTIFWILTNKPKCLGLEFYEVRNRVLVCTKHRLLSQILSNLLSEWNWSCSNLSIYPNFRNVHTDNKAISGWPKVGLWTTYDVYCNWLCLKRLVKSGVRCSRTNQTRKVLNLFPACGHALIYCFITSSSSNADWESFNPLCGKSPDWEKVLLEFLIFSPRSSNIEL